MTRAQNMLIEHNRECMYMPMHMRARRTRMCMVCALG
jgi:hypothetical protein